MISQKNNELKKLTDEQKTKLCSNIMQKFVLVNTLERWYFGFLNIFQKHNENYQ